ncbi:hypothetical protein B7989_10560 [Fibrobacter sp. UWB5]|nr:hypothetical protein B7989_10560 [Fibrobacter sp. UWB5]
MAKGYVDKKYILNLRQIYPLSHFFEKKLIFLLTPLQNTACLSSIFACNAKKLTMKDIEHAALNP